MMSNSVYHHGRNFDDEEFDDAIYFRHRDVLIWKEILRELIGWSNDKTERWAKRYKKNVMDESSWYSHQNTLIYPVNLLIPERIRLKQKADDLFNRLVWALELQMISDESRNPEGPFYNDWPGLRKLIDARLQEAGYTLEKLAAELADKDPAHLKIDYFRH